MMDGTAKHMQKWCASGVALDNFDFEGVDKSKLSVRAGVHQIYFGEQTRP